MGWRYRKSINLGGGLRINLSKSGVGYSWGGKGFRITKTATGQVRTTASIPKTGISYVETISTKRKTPKYSNYSNLTTKRSTTKISSTRNTTTLNHPYSEYGTTVRMLDEKPKVDEKPLIDFNTQQIPNTMYKSSSNPNNVTIWVVVVILIVIVGIIGNSNSYTSYSDRQIINLASHPKLYSNYQNAKAFYKDVSKSKVKLTTSHVYYEDDEKHLIHIEADSYDKGNVDEIRIYLNNSPEYRNISLEDALKITIDYLPINVINDYYDFECAFYDDNPSPGTLEGHYCKWHINDNGKEYNKTHNNELFKEIGFKLFYYRDVGSYKIFVGTTMITINEHIAYQEGKKPKWNFNINDYSS